MNTITSRRYVALLASGLAGLLLLVSTLFVTAQTTQFPLRINEVQPNPLPDSADYSNQFIEIYNPNSTTVELNRFSLRDAAGDGYTQTVYFFPQDAEIAPNATLAVYHSTTDIILDSNDSVLLLNADGDYEDAFTYDAVESDLQVNELFVRLADGTGDWYVCEHATPNALNDIRCDDEPDSEVALRGSLNELNPFPAPPADNYDAQYVEIWNPNSSPLDISGFQLSDAGDNRSSTTFTIPDGTVVQPNSGIAFFHSQTGIIIDPIDTLQLIDPADSGVDDSFSLDVAQDGLQDGDVYSRNFSQDGVGGWFVCDESTPNDSNADGCGNDPTVINLSNITSHAPKMTVLLVASAFVLLMLTFKLRPRK